LQKIKDIVAKLKLREAKQKEILVAADAIGKQIESF
jgi:hypothetical protein